MTDNPKADRPVLTHPTITVHPHEPSPDKAETIVAQTKVGDIIFSNGKIMVRMKPIGFDEESGQFPFLVLAGGPNDVSDAIVGKVYWIDVRKPTSIYKITNIDVIKL